MHVTSTILHTNDAAVAEVILHDENGPSGVFTGSSKRHPKDSPCRDVGVAIALARALNDAAEWLRLEAQALVDLNCGYGGDDIDWVSDGFKTSISIPIEMVLANASV